jgi:hypothetical protein
VWKKINRLREETRNEERIAIHHVQCMSVQRLQKMVETVFHGRKTYVIIYTTKQRNEEKEEGGPQDGRKKSNGLRERKSEALIIDPGDWQYADLLKKVKSSVAGTTAKEAIQSVRKTQTGKLLLTVGKGTGQARLLKEQLEKKIGSLNARIAERTETIYVLGVDALVTPQEVVEAIKTYRTADDKTNSRRKPGGCGQGTRSYGEETRGEGENSSGPGRLQDKRKNNSP